MTDKDILISDLNDISEILNNNGYGGWCSAIQKAVALLKEQPEVVRCVDCKWQKWGDPDDKTVYCGLYNSTENMNHFCSNGEKGR